MRHGIQEKGLISELKINLTRGAAIRMLTFAVQVLSCWRCQGHLVPVMGGTEADPWVCGGQQWWVP